MKIELWFGFLTILETFMIITIINIIIMGFPIPEFNRKLYCKGNMNTLKNTIAQGNPVIVMIRYQRHKSWLHYLPIVGYDEDYIYAAESLREKVNAADENYNRKIPIKEFKQLWNTSMLKMPLYRNTFFSVR